MGRGGMTTEPFSSVAYTIMAALAGAVTALAFRPWKKMTGLEIALTLFVGFSFAIFGFLNPGRYSLTGSQSLKSPCS